MRLFLTKKTKMIQGKKGHILDVKPDGSINVNATLSVGLNTPVDVVPLSSVTLNPVTYTEICKYMLPVGFDFKLQQMTVTLEGMSGHFVLEFFDGTNTSIVREYFIGNYIPFTEKLGTEKIFPYSVGSYLAFKGKLNGVGHTGRGYAVINGYY